MDTNILKEYTKLHIDTCNSASILSWMKLNTMLKEHDVANLEIKRQEGDTQLNQVLFREPKYHMKFNKE